MFKTVDNLNDVSGWSVSDPSVEVGLYSTDFPRVDETLIAGNLSDSLFIKFPYGSNNQYAEKTISFDASQYNEIILHAKSHYLKRRFVDTDDANYGFNYKIELNSSLIYYLPVTKIFEPIKIIIPEGETFDKIKITCLHDRHDLLTLSFMVAAKEELPFDIQKAVIESLSNEINQTEYLLGNITGSLSDNYVTLPEDDYLRELMSVKIGDQILKVKEINDKTIYFQEGDILNQNYTNEPCYIYFPIYHGNTNMVIQVPGIAVWAFEPVESKALTNNIGFRDYSFKEDGSKITLREGYNQLFGIQIDVMAFQDSLEYYLRSVVRNFIRKQNLWIAGINYEVEQTGPPQKIAETLEDQIPKVSYLIGIELEEQKIWEKINITNQSYQDNLTVEVKL